MVKIKNKMVNVNPGYRLYHTLEPEQPINISLTLTTVGFAVLTLKQKKQDNNCYHMVVSGPIEESLHLAFGSTELKN